MFFAWCILCKDKNGQSLKGGGFFSFSPWSFKEHFKSQNYLCNTSENENLCNACNHLKAYHGKAAMAGAALCVGWEAAPLTWFGIITDRVIDPTFLWWMLPPSLTQPLFCFDDLSWVFSFAKKMTVLASGPDINFYFMATWNLLCHAWEIAIAPLTSFLLASFPGLSWMGSLNTQVSYILEKYLYK